VLAPASLELNWNMTFSVNNAEVTSVFVPHGESRTFSTLVQTSNLASAGTHTPVAAVIDQALGQHLLPMPVKVVQFFGVELTAQEFKLAGSPSRTLQYDLELKNVGNGPDSFTLSVEDLAVEVWNAKFQQLQVRQNTTNPLVNDEVFVDADVVSLLAHDTTTLRLLITVPRDTTSRQVQFTARATSASGEQDSLILVTDIKLADLKIDRVDFSPTTPVPGQITAITVAVANVGDIEGAPIIVEFRDNGQVLATDQVSRIAQGQRGYVTFAWLPTPGEHSLQFVVDPSFLDEAGVLQSRGHVIEVNEDDNTFTVAKPVGAQTSFLPGFDGAVALGAVAAGAVVLSALRRRRA